MSAIRPHGPEGGLAGCAESPADASPWPADHDREGMRRMVAEAVARVDAGHARVGTGLANSKAESLRADELKFLRDPPGTKAGRPGSRHRTRREGSRRLIKGRAHRDIQIGVLAGSVVAVAILALVPPLVGSQERPASTPLNAAERMDLERYLAALDFRTGAVDGHLDADSLAAVRRYRLLAGMDNPDGRPDRALLIRLRETFPNF